MAIHDEHDVLGELMRDSLDHCVKCTICETFCPVSNVTPLFPGPKYVGPQAERFRVDGEPSPDASLDYCSGCGICTQVCPHGVHIAEINSQAREQLKKTTGYPLRDRLIARSAVVGRLGTPVAPLANRTLRSRTLRTVAERTLGLHRDAPMPQFAGRRPARGVLPRVRHELVRAAPGGDDGRAARAQRDPGRRPAPAVLLRA